MATRGAAFNISLVLVLSLALQVQGGTQLKQSNRRPSASASPEEYVPVKSVVYRPSTTTATEAVSSYEPFELCQGCRCCSSSNVSRCVDTSCCYAIDCDLPGKPFGTCAFTPHTCGCGTGNCTQLS
ncbi:unnamed protein product [Miscanthus lutarioriparius]|uniref:DUF7866 domain-containing protein n=1 Tax=Miscanthus lutarioriparius TaxID=422564 RepID=A0A811RLB8_9POAL|nr:unnamed protein product [Miscanthus lutarioriparius]